MSHANYSNTIWTNNTTPTIIPGPISPIKPLINYNDATQSHHVSTTTSHSPSFPLLSCDPMSTKYATPPTLLEWLYLSDDTMVSNGNFNQNINEKQGTLVVFPRMIDRWNISSLIVSKWEVYKVVIVTDYPNEFMNTLINSGNNNHDWKDLELIPFELIKYSNISDINRILRNTEIDIILFDDARMLATISSALDFTSVQPKIIILTSWGDTYQQLDIITSNLPNLSLLTPIFINDPIGIKWNLVKVPMSSRQLPFYNQIRKQELTDQNILQYPLTRMITLYSYPDPIMTDTLQHKTICETDQTSIPDRLHSPNTWLNNDYLDKLDINGPKLASLIDGVISNWPNKQLIVTRFNHRYGVDLITSFLQLLIQNQRNPYEIHELFRVSCTEDYDINLNTFHKFNSLDSAILITNIVPLIPLKDTSIVHIVDSYSFSTVKMIIDRCHKRYLNKRVADFTIYSYIATHPTEISSDLALYELLHQNVEEANRLYNGIINSSGHIVF